MFDKRGEFIIHVDWYILTKDLKLPANRRNNFQHCWPNNVWSCCVCATTPNNMQQGVQTDATCNIQQCWELLAKNVASVCTLLKDWDTFVEMRCHSLILNCLPVLNSFMTKLYFFFLEINLIKFPPGVLILRFCRLLFISFMSNLELVYPCAGFIPSLRPDCGYYGIQKEECLRRLCCWDDTIQNVPWCFKSSKKNKSL